MIKKISLMLVALISVFGIGIAPAHAQHSDTQQASAVVQSGTFTGRNNHVTTGTVSIVKTGSGYVAILEGNFSLDGAPAPTLGFGKNGFKPETEFTKLASPTGLQVYAIPDSIDPKNFDEFYVWCSDFSVALGVASLK